MSFPRCSGVLLHPTSLPARFGVDDLGPAAFEFIDALASAGQHLWQVLPLGPTGYGDSPYQCFSAFAGNPLFISIESIVEQGLLTGDEARLAQPVEDGDVDYAAVVTHRAQCWPLLLERFDRTAPAGFRSRFEDFCRSQADWLDDFALFMAVKMAHGRAAWTGWEGDIARRDPAAVARWSAQCAREMRMHKLTQFLFFEQWARVRDACHSHGIVIMGDLPIFVAHDSADVWAHPDVFKLDAGGRPRVLAGVPPDYFSETGQLWGNPHYRWEALARTGYAWWIARFRALLTLVDRIRASGSRAWPILQFAFGNDPQAPDFKPHNFPRNRVVYTGTHDNDTTIGWWTGGAGHSTRSIVEIETERECARRYLALDDREVHWAFIRAALGSVADTAIVPARDLLGLGSEARMNRPGTAAGNWRWLKPGQLSSHVLGKLASMAETYDRCEPTSD